MKSPRARDRSEQASGVGILHGDPAPGHGPDNLHPGLHFLGLDAASGAPFYPPLEPRQAPGLTLRRRLRAGSCPDDLAEAGWGVILPRKVDPAVVRALEPLFERRRQQAGSLYRELTYWPREGPGAFLSRLRAGPGPVVPETVPYYLLIVGDPEQVPHGFQFQLELQYAVGRLAFDTPEDYGRYARGVLAAEDRRRTFEHDLELFSVGHDAADPATDVARRHLVNPLEASLPERLSGLRVQRTDGADATKAALGRRFAEADSALVLTVGHSALFRQGNARQRPCQGAIVCADWPAEGPAFSRQYFAASDLDPDADLGGRIFFLFGCHTAGTPRLDSFGPPGRRSERRTLTEAPFLARLPQALLSHPAGGALAVVAHVDRAFPQHTLGSHADHQGQCFEGVLHDLLSHRPVGLAMDNLAARHAELAARLAARALEAGDDDEAEDGTDAPSLEELWAAYCDVRSHVVLGDPAVCL